VCAFTNHILTNHVLLPGVLNLQQNYEQLFFEQGLDQRIIEGMQFVPEGRIIRLIDTLTMAQFESFCQASAQKHDIMIMCRLENSSMRQRRSGPWRRDLTPTCHDEKVPLVWILANVGINDEKAWALDADDLINRRISLQFLCKQKVSCQAAERFHCVGLTSDSVGEHSLDVSYLELHSAFKEYGDKCSRCYLLSQWKAPLDNIMLIALPMATTPSQASVLRNLDVAIVLAYLLRVSGSNPISKGLASSVAILWGDDETNTPQPEGLVEALHAQLHAFASHQDPAELYSRSEAPFASICRHFEQRIQQQKVASSKLCWLDIRNMYLDCKRMPSQGGRRRGLPLAYIYDLDRVSLSEHECWAAAAADLLGVSIRFLPQSSTSMQNIQGDNFSCLAHDIDTQMSIPTEVIYVRARLPRPITYWNGDPKHAEAESDQMHLEAARWTLYAATCSQIVLDRFKRALPQRK
jgi:hypothetical protein